MLDAHQLKRFRPRLFRLRYICGIKSQQTSTRGDSLAACVNSFHRHQNPHYMGRIRTRLGETIAKVEPSPVGNKNETCEEEDVRPTL